MPDTVRSTNFAIAISAPVLPADTTPAASPDFTASIAGPASVFASTHHCSEISGSTMVRDRWQCPTGCVYGSIFSMRPAASRSATMRLRASNRSMPSYCPAAAFSVPSLFMMLMISRP